MTVSFRTSGYFEMKLAFCGKIFSEKEQNFGWLFRFFKDKG